MSWSVELRLVAANVNPQPAEYALFTVMVDGAIGTTPALCEDCGRMELLLDMEPRTAPRLIHKHGIPGSFPIWQDLSLRVVEFPRRCGCLRAATRLPGRRRLRS